MQGERSQYIQHNPTQQNAQPQCVNVAILPQALPPPNEMEKTHGFNFGGADCGFDMGGVSIYTYIYI